jgi:lysophospholipase L1-like esterase
MNTYAMLLTCATLTAVAAAILSQPPAPVTPSLPQPASDKAVPAQGNEPAKAQPMTATTPISKTEPWWQERHAAMNARVKQAAEKGDARLLFIGDSITQGWEGEGKEVWKERFEERGAINLGIGGDKTQHVLWRLQNGNLQGLATPAAGAAPKVAVIMIGTNNVADTQPQETAAGIDAIVREVKAKIPTIKVLVLAVFPREEKPGFARERNIKVNEAAALLMKGMTDVTFMDIGGALTNPDGTISRDVMPDYLHLSPKGYAAWADAIEPVLVKMLGESK